MITLTPEQAKAIADAGEIPARVVDPVTETEYVLVHAEAYEQLSQAARDHDQDFVEGVYPLMAEVFGAEGWDDPAMDVYHDLDPRRP